MPDMKQLVDKFRSLDFRTRRVELALTEEETPDPVAEQEAMLADLARTRECKEALLPYLKGLLKVYEAEMSQYLQSPPDMCAVQGKKEAIRALKEKLQELGEG